MIPISGQNSIGSIIAILGFIYTTISVIISYHHYWANHSFKIGKNLFTYKLLSIGILPKKLKENLFLKKWIIHIRIGWTIILIGVLLIIF